VKRLFSALRSEQEFEVAKTTPIAGLWLGLLLWSLVFITIGGEWFLMWQSSQWNGELAALRMFDRANNVAAVRGFNYTAILLRSSVGMLVNQRRFDYRPEEFLKF
jgi:Predicted small integral membrane protein (DUF2165)